MAYNYVIPSGTIVPDTQDTLTIVQGEYQVTFGQNLNLSPSTIQGRLIEIETTSRNDAARNNAQLANQINPNLAGGIYLDAIFALMNSERNNTTYTTTIVNLTGQPLTPIASNVLFTNTVTGEQFMTTSAVVLDSGGLGSAPVQAINPGPISADPGTITGIVASTAPLGLETVTNPNPPITLGTLTQSDSAANNYRNVTLASQSVGQEEAIITALYLTTGVTSVNFRKNDMSTPQTIDGVLLAANSIYVIVAGGTDLDVATTIDRKKQAGCGYNGSTSVDIVNPFSGQTITVLFDRPTIIGILVRITANASNFIGDPVAAIKQAVLDYVGGQLAGEQGLQIGVSVSPWELGGACNREVPSIFINNVEIALLSDGIYGNTVIPIGINKQALITGSYISVDLI